MALTVVELAQTLQQAVPDSGAASVFTGVSSLGDAGPNEVSFLGNPKYESQLATTKAGALLVAVGQELPEGLRARAVVFEVENPTAEFSKVIAHFQGEIATAPTGAHPAAIVDESAVWDSEKVTIGPGAVVEAGATIGNGSVLEAGAVVARGAKIGQDCHLFQHAVVRERCVLGDRVRLQPHAVVGSDGFGYEMVNGRHEKVPQVGIVVVEDEVEIGSHSCIDRARFGETRIGEGSKIDNLVQIAHNVVIGKHCIVVAQSGIAGSTSLGNYVVMGAQSGIAGHLEIGDQVTFTSRAGVLRSIRQPGIFMGYPARPMKQEQAKLAALARLPKLAAEFKSLKKKLLG